MMQRERAEQREEGIELPFDETEFITGGPEGKSATDIFAVNLNVNLERAI